jgi:hypothetical protein
MPRPLIAPRPAASRTRSCALGLALAAALLTPLAGCAGGGGGGAAPGGASSSASTPPAPAPGAFARAHRSFAQAALGTPYAPVHAPRLDDPGFAQWSDLLEKSWPALRQWIDPVLEAQVRAALGGAPGGPVRVVSVRSVTLDTSAPPRISGDGTGAGVAVALPGAPGTWSLAVDLAADVTTRRTVLGVPVTLGVSLDLTLAARGIRISDAIAFDLQDPVRPAPSRVDPPALAVTVDLSSRSPVIAQVAPLLSQALDPVIRGALLLGASEAQRRIAGYMGRMPNVPFGTGGTPQGPVTPAPDLARLAEETSDLIRRDHLPYGTLLAVRYDRPGFGNGVPVGYGGMGDSALWTGLYLAAEATRYDVSGGDPRALDGARTALLGLRRCLDVPGRGGLLCRGVAPLGALGAPGTGRGNHVGVSDGVTYAGIGDISRDQYIGCLYGLTSAHLGVPPLRAEAGVLLERIAAYLESTGWIAYQADGVTISTPFTQTPDVLWSVVQAAHNVDPARWGALHLSARELPTIQWLPMWVSTRELLTAYYPVNILHGTMATLVQGEADPALYREYIKGFEIVRDATGHHQNAFFDAVYGMAVPSAAPRVGPVLEAALQHFARRDRRVFTPDTRSDPSVAKVLYTPPAVLALPGSAPQGGFWVAATPLDVEKRRHSDFLWQQSPFHLSHGSSDPYVQEPGADLLLPYWLGRAYGMLR